CYGECRTETRRVGPAAGGQRARQRRQAHTVFFGRRFHFTDRISPIGDSSVKKILAQLTKEFMLFRRDKLLIMLAVLMPVVLMSLAGGTQSLRLRNVPLLVYDYDNSALSRTYLETYGAALTFRLTKHPPDESPEEALNSWRGRAALIIPQNFERDARRGAEPVVQLMIDATDSNAATALGNYAQTLNTSFAQRSGIGEFPPKLVNME